MEGTAYLQELRERNPSDIFLTDIFPGSIAFILLHIEEIFTIKDLIQKTEKELMAFKGFGAKKLQMVKNVLFLLGYSLREN
jgi:DNA-directed RNA polymerase alpha subunit